MRDFKEVAVGQTFWFNGNEFTKKSTRTAYIHKYNRIFYFRQFELVRIN
jgi:hypothetical protein